MMPTSGVPSEQISSGGWRQRRPQEGRAVNYISIPTAVVYDRPSPRRFIRKHRHNTERVVCKVQVLDMPHNLSLLAEDRLDSDSEATCELVGCTPPSTRTPASGFCVALRRASQRWSALVSAPTSRIARLMRPVLGEAHWAAFVAHANANCKPAFIAAFEPPSHVLHCVGQERRPCPHGFKIDLTSAEVASSLAHLHLDHEQDLQITCDMWKEALPPSRKSWDDGVNGRLLCHLLFGVDADSEYGPAMVRFRCGPSRFGSDAGYCARLRD